MTWLDAQTIPKPINGVYLTMISCFHVKGIRDPRDAYFAWTIWNQVILDGKLTETQMIFYSCLGTPPKNEHVEPKVTEVWFR